MVWWSCWLVDLSWVFIFCWLKEVGIWSGLSLWGFSGFLQHFRGICVLSVSIFTGNIAQVKFLKLNLLKIGVDFGIARFLHGPSPWCLWNCHQWVRCCSVCIHVEDQCGMRKVSMSEELELTFTGPAIQSWSNHIIILLLRGTRWLCDDLYLKFIPFNILLIWESLLFAEM